MFAILHFFWLGDLALGEASCPVVEKTMWGGNDVSFQKDSEDIGLVQSHMSDLGNGSCETCQQEAVLSRSSLEMTVALAYTLITTWCENLSQRAQAAVPRFLIHRNYETHILLGDFGDNLLCSNGQRIYLRRHIKHFGCEDLLQVHKKTQLNFHDAALP